MPGPKTSGGDFEEKVGELFEVDEEADTDKEPDDAPEDE